MEKAYKYSSFEYKIIRKKRKTIGIKITAEGEVIVTSPFNTSEETILDIIKEKEKWIKDKLQLFAQHPGYKGRNFKSGEKFLYLGSELKLEIYNLNEDKIEVLGDYSFNNDLVRVLNEKVIVYIHDNKNNREDIIRDLIIKFYRIEAQKVLTERTSYYSKIIGVTLNKITIKDQKTVWGSCSSKKNINYSYRLIMAPIHIIDYLVIHELCHLIHMNHSKEYWKAVESVLPDYRERKQWLKSYGHTLKI